MDMNFAPSGDDFDRFISAPMPSKRGSKEHVKLIGKCWNCAVYEVYLTPELAKKFLEKNLKNRTIRTKRVAQLVRSLEAGRFVFNGDTITFDVDGVMVNGQHRCTAIVQSGVAATVMVVLNLSPTSRRTVDDVVKRTAADNALMEGTNHAPLTMAITRLLMALKHGLISPSRSSFSNDAVWDFFAARPEIEESASAVKSIRDLTASHVGAVHYIATNIQRSPKIDDFIHVIKTVMGAEDCPARLWALRCVKEHKSSRTLLAPDLKFAGTLKAWDLFNRGVEIKKFQFGRNDPSKPPVIEGVDYSSI